MAGIYHHPLSKKENNFQAKTKSMTFKCSQCGLCCKLFLINLSEKEYLSGKFNTQLQKFDIISNFRKAVSCGANILAQKSGGSCIYLENNNCSIHKTRPQVCRKFFCTSKAKQFKEMIEQIENANSKFTLRDKNIN